MKIRKIVIDEDLSCRLANTGFVCMCLVVLLHVETSFETGSWMAFVRSLVIGVAQIAVPSFFLISGFLLAGHFDEKGWWIREVRKRVASLLVPYLLWNLVYLLFDRGFDISGGGVLHSFGRNPFKFPEFSYMWFVRCLIVFVVASPVFAVFRFCYLGAALITLCACAYLIMPVFYEASAGWEIHFIKDGWMKGLMYFSAGIWLRWNGASLKPLCTKAICFGAGAIGMVYLVLSFKFHFHFVSRLLPMPFVIVFLFYIISSRRWSVWLTKSAFPIFLMHKIGLTVIGSLFGVIGIQAWARQSLIFYFLTAGLTILACIGSTVAIRLLWPFGAKILFGGR